MSITNPRQMPQFGTWSVPNCPLTLEYDLEVLETIRREVVSGFRAPRGGVETGGLLLGTYDGTRVRITGFEPVGCDHKLGPKFILTEDETEALNGQLLAHRMPGQENREVVVGWYQSHLRRGLTLSSEDVQIYDRHFPELWQVALLLRPDPAGGIHARFFLREPATSARNTAVDRTKIARAPTKPVGVEAAADAPGGLQGEPAAAQTPDRRLGLQNKAVWTVLAVMFAIAVVSALYMRFNFALSPHSVRVLHLEAIAQDRGLELRWDPKELTGASRGRLEIRDGASVQQVSLDRRTLDSGLFIYRQTSDVIGFRLQADPSSGSPLEGSAMYIGRNAKPDTLTAAAVPPPVTAAPVTPTPPPAVIAAAQPPAPIVVENEKPKTRAEASRPSPPAVSLPPARVVEQTKQATPAPAVTTPTPKREEPAKPRVEAQPPVAPVQQTAPPPVSTDVPAAVPIPAPRVELATAVPPRVIPKESTPVPPAPSSPPWRLNGRWTLQNGGYSRSPAVPEAVSITVQESDGTVQGTVDARYKGRSKAERVHFSFSGKVTNGVARFGWTSTSGQRGHIEFIRIPNSPDIAEVVWQNPENNHVFDEMLRRAN